MNSCIIRKSRSLSELITNGRPFSPQTCKIRGSSSPNDIIDFFIPVSDEIDYRNKKKGKIKEAIRLKSPKCFLPEFSINDIESNSKTNDKVKTTSNKKISSIAFNEFMNMMIDNG